MNRLHAVVFWALCAAGVAASIGLTIHEVARTAPIALHVSAKHRTGLTTTLTISVRNTTASTRCVSVRVGAFDRTGHQLAAVTAAPALTLAPHASRSVQARLALTARQYAEDLQTYYPSSKPCRAR